MEYQIHGKVFQSVEFKLGKNEVILSEPGRLLWMDKNIRMDTSVHGGIIEGLKRKITGEKFMVMKFRAIEDYGHLALAGDVPGKILSINLDNKSIICEKKAFIAGEEGVKVSPYIVKSVTYGLFSKDKFLFQKLSGKGIAYISSAGEMTTLKLKDSKIYVDLAAIVAFDSDISISVVPLPGIKNILFSEQGFLIAKLEGTGEVIIQNTPKLYMALMPKEEPSKK